MAAAETSHQEQTQRGVVPATLRPASQLGRRALAIRHSEHLNGHNRDQPANSDTRTQQLPKAGNTQGPPTVSDAILTAQRVCPKAAPDYPSPLAPKSGRGKPSLKTTTAYCHYLVPK